MNLKNIFGSNKKQVQAEYFLAVEIHESLIKSVCWEVVDGEPSIVQLGSFEAWEDEESLINGVDASITESVKNLGTEPRRVILGLPESWFEESSIHPTKKSLIKHLLESLALDAIGVVSTTQAITHYLKQTEGIPPTAILLEIFQTKVVVSVVKTGKVEQTEEVGVSGDIARDVEEGLARMELDRLPARFLLTDGTSLEDEQQQLVSYPWQEKLPFIHMPKVEVLPVDFSIKAIAMTGGTEAAESLGVVINEDVTKDALPKEESNISIPNNKTTPSLENLGFSYEETEAPTEIPQDSDQKLEINHLVPQLQQEVDSKAEYAVSEEASTTLIHRSSLGIPKSTKIISGFKFSFPRINFGAKLPLIIGFVLLLSTLIGITGVYFFLGKAQITVSITPQKINKELSIAIAEAQQGSTPTLISTKKSISGTALETISTTGEAIVGDKSSGSITIANKTVAPIVLKSGSIITTDNGKTSFVIQDAVTIASKSADPLTFQETYGKATGVKVTASKIGAESNLNKDTTFSVDNYSKTIVYAVAETDFTGGNSKTVKAVSKSDQEKLIALGTEKIKQQTQEQLSQTDPSTGALPLNDLTFTKKNFNHNVNEEASTVTLDMAGSVDLLVYSKEELFKLASSQLKEQLPIGMVLSQNGTDIQVNNPVKGSDGVYNAKVVISANLKPDFDSNQWASLIKGKTLSAAKDILSRINGYSSLNAKMSPPIPYLSANYLPLKNITIDIVTQ